VAQSWACERPPDCEPWAPKLHARRPIAIAGGPGECYPLVDTEDLQTNSLGNQRMDAIQTILRSYIADTFLDEESASELTNSTPLITGGILDSINTLKLVLFLEERFKIDVEAHEVGIDHLDSVEKIGRLVYSKKADAA
jgi:acyl carrier protein